MAQVGNNDSEIWSIPSLKKSMQILLLTKKACNYLCSHNSLFLF